MTDDDTGLAVDGERQTAAANGSLAVDPSHSVAEPAGASHEGGREAIGAGTGALGGAAIGMAVAGPPGAIVGGAVGAVVGAVAGEASEGHDLAGSGAGALAGLIAGAALGGAVAGPPGAVVGGAVGAAGGAGAGDRAEEEAEEASPSSNPGRFQGSQPISSPKISFVSAFESSLAAIAMMASGCM